MGGTLGLAGMDTLAQNLGAEAKKGDCCNKLTCNLDRNRCEK